MKKVCKIKFFALAFALLFVFCIFAVGCENTMTNERDLIRLHVRANSNHAVDQEVKLKVRDKVVEYLESKSLGSNVKEVYATLNSSLKKIKTLCDDVLKKEGFSYTATVTLDERYFPARSYDDVVIPSGYYDALIIELGSGKGDNWWCVIYPPLCYLEARAEKNVVYKSKLVELIKKYFSLSYV